MLPLPPDEVHVWLVFEDEVRDPRLLAGYRDLLSEQERAQEDRFYFAADRHRYRVARVLIRTLLSRYLCGPPQHWRFETNPYGKPRLAAAQFPVAAPSFNLSHTDGLIVCALARGATVGVDAENCRRQRVPLEIAGHYFAPSEVAALRGLQPRAKRVHFFHYWTLKESYIKALGTGLSTPLDVFGFDLDDCAGIRLRVLDDGAPRWNFWLLEPSPRHVLAVCAERVPRQLRLVVRKTIPLAGDEPLDCPVLRRSAA